MASNLSHVFHRDRVLFKPALRTKLLLSLATGASDRGSPFSRPGIHLTFSGRTALFQACPLLGLTPGDVVLCPAYNCGHEIEPFLRQGVSVRFYGVDRNMRVDLEDLQSRVDERTRAILVTHYFGFPQDRQQIGQICLQHGLRLIEDCAHVLLGHHEAANLGTMGDLAIFSIRKFLPVPDGGALLLNDSPIKRPLSLRPPPWRRTWIKTLEQWRNSFLVPSSSPAHSVANRLVHLLGLPVILARRAWPFSSESPRGSNGRLDYDSDLLSWGMAATTRRILRIIDLEEVVSRRRENFAFLLESLGDVSGCLPVYTDLPDTVCPLAFPLLTPASEEWTHRLREHGISVTRWWDGFHSAVPWAEFPDSVFLKRNLIALPVHQDLGPRCLDRMVTELRKLAQSSPADFND